MENREKILELEARIKVLTEALENIISPIVYLQKEAVKEGAKLDGLVAVALAKDPYFLQTIAEKALTKSEDQNK